MTIGFKTKINGKANFFIDKIWLCLYRENIFALHDYIKYFRSFENIFNSEWDTKIWASNELNPKLHTIRELWKNKKTGEISDRQIKSGDNLHFVIGNRTPKRFQFAPVVKCISVQNIEIKYFEPHKNRGFVYVDGILISDKSTNILAVNDGFDSVEDFFAYFSKNFTGQIIHWTDLKYQS